VFTPRDIAVTRQSRRYRTLFEFVAWGNSNSSRSYIRTVSIGRRDGPLNLLSFALHSKGGMLKYIPASNLPFVFIDDEMPEITVDGPGIDWAYIMREDDGTYTKVTSWEVE
jgi:hypothetical protein